MIWKYLYSFLHVIIYIIAKLLFRYKAIGAEHIPKKGSAILASNHASYLDPPFVGLGVWRRINYLAKKEMFRNIFIIYLLKKLFRSIPVDREQMDRNTLRKIYQLLSNNEVLLMFPEGTRTYNGKLMEPKIGIGMIAYNTRVPVIPVYISGTFNIWPRDSKSIHIKPCSVFFSPPVDLKPYYKQKKSKELYKEISEKIMEGIKELEQKT
jgi:1-acyl-sn-glycerol-3-phosphate acyltransferase